MDIVIVGGGIIGLAAARLIAERHPEHASLVDDFRIDSSPHATWVRNAPSPGATSSLAIAEELVGRMPLAG